MVAKEKKFFYVAIFLLLASPFVLGGCWGRMFFHMPGETFSTSRKVDSLLAENAKLETKVDSLAEMLNVTQDYTRVANAQLKIDIEEIKDDINALKEMLREGGTSGGLRAAGRRPAAQDTSRGTIPAATDTGLAVSPALPSLVPGANTSGKAGVMKNSAAETGTETAEEVKGTATDTDTAQTKAIPSPEAIYRQGYLYFNRGAYKLAIEELSNFLKAYPDEPLAEDAHFLKGESFFELGSFFDAIKEFSTILSKYPRGDKVPGALLRMALAYEKVGERDLALGVARRLVREHPYTEEASAAKEHFKELSPN